MRSGVAVDRIGYDCNFALKQFAATAETTMRELPVY